MSSVSPIKPEFADSLSQAVRDVEVIARKSGSMDNPIMSEPITRPELDAKLATIEAKMDGRIARIEDAVRDIRDSLSSTRRNVWGAAAVTIAAVLAGFALIVTSFDSGRDTANMATAAQAQTNAALAEIRQIVSDLKSTAPPPSQ